MVPQAKNSGSRIFILVCGLACLMTIYNIFFDIHFERQLNLIVNALGASYYLLSILFVVWIKNYNRLIYPTLIITFMIIAIMWVTNGGAKTVGPFYSTFLILTLVLIQKQRRVLVLSILLLLMAVFLILEFVLGFNFYRYDNVTFPLDFFILTFITVVLMLSFKQNFEKERRLTVKYTHSLKQLHRLNLSKEKFSEVMKDYLASGCELFGIDNGFIAKMDGKYATIISTYGELADKSLPMKVHHDDFFQLSEMKVGSTVHFNIPLGEVGKVMHNFTVRTYLAVPIFINDRLVGLLCYFSSTARNDKFESIDLELIELMSQNISHLMKIQNDELHNKRINDALLQSELRFRSIFEKSPVGITLTALDGDFLLVNPAIQEMLGYDEYEFLQMNVRDLIVDSKGTRSRWEHLKRGQIDTYTIEHIAKTKSGENIKIAVATSLVKKQAMDEPLVLGIVEDITKLKEKEQQIEDLNAKLEMQVQKLQAAYKELESFSYSVSHDLRAPLRAINSFSNIMSEEYGQKLDQEGNRLLTIIIRNGERMGQLIDDLLEFSRLSRLDRVFSNFNLQALVFEVINETKDSIPGRSFEFVVTDLPEVRGDRAMIKQLLSNLISNAIKFSSKNDNPRVEIFYNDSDKSYHQIGIRDNGVGFDMKYYDKLFGVFQRLHSEQEFDGTGVGLAIVQRIISRHEGKIWAESKLGEGAVFYFTLHR